MHRWTNVGLRSHSTLRRLAASRPGVARLAFEPLERRVLLSGTSQFTNQDSLLSEPTLPDHVVRAAYIVPANRTAQATQIEAMQTALKWYQQWYADQMDRYGFGPKTFAYETEPDEVTPKIHTVSAPQEDTYFQEDQWSRVSSAANDAGLPIWHKGQIWLEVFEALTIDSDGKIHGGTALGGGWGTGSGAGVAMFGASPMSDPDWLVDDRAYDGTVFPELGPYPLKAEVSFPWFEGTTFSSVASSHYGAICHEMSHAFGLGHDFRNDANANGNLMGNGLRGFRGWAAASQYPSEDLRLSYGAALAMNVSRYFNGDRVYTDDTPPDVNVHTTGTVDLVDGLLEIEFTASDPSELACALLRRNGDTVAELTLDGTSIDTSFRTWMYEPGKDNQFTVSVYDTQGNQQQQSVTIVPTSGFNRAPQPSLRIDHSIVSAGETIVLDASQSSDPDDGKASLLVQWDLDGDGLFETQPTTEKKVSTTYDATGPQVVRVRVTDPHGAQSISAPLALRVMPASQPRVEELGIVDFREATGVGLSGTLTYQLETAHTGWLTIENASASTHLQLFDDNPLTYPDRQPVANGQSTIDGSQRLDYLADRGNMFYFQLSGSDDKVDWRVVNLLDCNGTAVTVYGTNGNDQLTFSADDSRSLTINGAAYVFEDAELTSVEFAGDDGFDEVRLYDSAGNETIEAWPDRAVFANGSGDSTNDFTVNVSGTESILAYATRGGNDSAILHGSEAGDKLKSYEDSLRLRAKDNAYALRAKRFDAITADSGAAGNDTAVFNGSDGNNTFRYDGATNTARLEATDRDHTAIGFGAVVARAGSDGHDSAHFTDTPQDDVFYFKSHKTVLVSDQAKVTARAFDEVHATSSDDQKDVARIYDTPGDERLLIEGGSASLYHWNDPDLELMYETIGFHRVKAYSTEGDDKRDERAHTIDDLLLYGWEEEV